MNMTNDALMRYGFILTVCLSQIVNGILGYNIALLFFSLFIILLSLENSYKFKMRFNFIILWIIFIILSLIVTFLVKDIFLTTKTIIMITTAFLSWRAISIMSYRNIFNKINFISANYLILILAFIFFILGYLGYSLIDILGQQTRSKVGLFHESSHLFLYVGFSYCFLIFSKKVYLPSILFFTMILLSQATTGILIMIMALGIFFLAKKNNIFFPVVVFLVSIIILALIKPDIIDSFIQRISGVFAFNLQNEEQIHLSSMVWLNGWSQAYNYLSETYWIGVGVGNMGQGSFSNLGFYSDFLLYHLGYVLNQIDGSFAASKIISELGFIGILIVVVATVKIYKKLSIFIYMSRAGMNPSPLYAAAAIMLFILLFVRSDGYMSIPFFIAIYFTFFKTSKRKIEGV